MAANESRRDCRLYAISPPHIDDINGFASRLEAVLVAADVAVFQLRLKGADNSSIESAANVLLPICRAHDCLFILNDSPELAGLVGADGVHLGEDDMSVKKAREIIGEDMVIGASAYDSMGRAMELGEAGADYVAFGACYPSQTKDQPRRAGLELFQQWSEQAMIASVAIGGITVENLHDIVVAGADYIAVCHALWQGDDPAANARQLGLAIDAALSA